MTSDELPQLASLAPSMGGLDRDALLFEAGKAAGRRGWFWKLAALVLAVTQSLTAAGWLRSAWPADAPSPPPSVAPVVEPPTPPTPTPPRTGPAQTDEQWLDAMLNRGRRPEPPLSVARGPTRQPPTLTPRSDPRAVLMQ